MTFFRAGLIWLFAVGFLVVSILIYNNYLTKSSYNDQSTVSDTVDEKVNINDFRIIPTANGNIFTSTHYGLLYEFDPAWQTSIKDNNVGTGISFFSIDRSASTPHVPNTVQVNFWSDISGFLSYQGETDIHAYRDMAAYLETHTAPVELISLSKLEKANAFEVSIGGNGLWYGYILETPKGIIQFEFPGAWDKSYLNNEEVRTLESIELYTIHNRSPECTDVPEQLYSNIVGIMIGPIWSPDCTLLAWSSMGGGRGSTGIESRGTLPTEGLFVYDTNTGKTNRLVIPAGADFITLNSWLGNNRLLYAKNGKLYWQVIKLN